MKVLDHLRLRPRRPDLEQLAFLRHCLDNVLNGLGFLFVGQGLAGARLQGVLVLRFIHQHGGLESGFVAEEPCVHPQ